MSKKTKKFVTLHSVSYDDPDFGRVLVKPNVVIELADAKTIKELQEAKAIRAVNHDESDLREGVEVEDELDAARKNAGQQDDGEGDGLGDDDGDADADADDEGDQVDVGALTVAQLKEGLDAAGVEYAPNAKKAALIELYTANVK